MNTQTVSKDLSNAAKDVKDTRDELTSAIKHASEDIVNQGQKAYSEASRYVRDKTKDLQGSAQEAMQTVKTSVKSRPFLYMAGAIAFGAFLGAMLGRREARAGRY